MTNEELEIELNKIQARTADILGELDHVGATNAHSSHGRPYSSPPVSEARIMALSTQLKHFEQKRHHLMLEHAQKGITDAAANCETLLAHILEERVAAAQARHNPDHAYIHVKGLGIHIEASGKEDDPNFQRIQKTVEEIGDIITATKQAVVAKEIDERERVMAEEERESALNRELRRKHSGLA